LRGFFPRTIERLLEVFRVFYEYSLVNVILFSILADFDDDETILRDLFIAN
jgi:hypothetical protein